MAELNKKKLGDRIKKLRLSFQRPYHVFSIMENGDVFLVFESEKGERLSFREKTLVGATKKAEDYLIAMNIRSGQVAKIKEQQQIKDGGEPETPPAAIEGPPTVPQAHVPNEDDPVEIKSTTINDNGEKVKE
ncbi:MAG TPA: hypothetical protein ENI23_00035 [bacterium]|nr:hypothetical protein [bacterium]